MHILDADRFRDRLTGMLFGRLAVNGALLDAAAPQNDRTCVCEMGVHPVMLFGGHGRTDQSAAYSSAFVFLSFDENVSTEFTGQYHQCTFEPAAFTQNPDNL